MNPNLPRVLTLLYTWKDTVRTTQRLVESAIEEAENLHHQGPYVVLGEIDKLLQQITIETQRADTLLSHGASSTDPTLHESFNLLMSNLNQMDLLLLNCRIEASRLKDYRKGYQVVVEELENLLTSLTETLTEINQLWGNSKENTLEEQMIQHLQKAANRVNLLSLNNSIEAARSGESGATFIVFSDELKKMAQTIQHATTQLEKNFVKKKAE